MNQKRHDQAILLALMLSICGLIAVVAFAAGLITQKNLLDHNETGGPAEVSSLASDSSPGTTTDNFTRLEEVQKYIQDEYYNLPGDSAKLGEFWNDLEGNALEGLTKGLDGYSAYLRPAQQHQAENQLEGTFEGIGVWVASRNGKLTIVAPIPGSPAEEAGIRAGDTILKIDDRSVEGLSDTEALDLLRGPSGEKVNLEILRTEIAAPLTFSVERRKMPIPVVNYRYLDKEHIAVIDITVFGDKTAAELDTALGLAEQDGATGIVLDLRNNGGGWVESAQQTIGRFVSEKSGPALYEDFDPQVQGDEQAEPILGDGMKEFDIPVSVLVNGGTASAAEIVAGALRDYKRATLVGEKSFGKGSVQRVHEFDDGSSFRVTFAHWFTPDKHAIDGVGIEPDQTVAATPSGQQGDAQLDAAVAVLEKEIAK